MHRTVIFILCLASWALIGVAQSNAYLQYIETYKIMAIDQMQRYRIPASITLAQGLIESDAGRSTLATVANNHFGIKTGALWNGPYILRNDDAKIIRAFSPRAAATLRSLTSSSPIIPAGLRD